MTKTLTIRELRQALSRLDELVADEGEIVVTRHGKALARVVPLRSGRSMPTHASLRAAMPRLSVGSEALIREDRNGR